MYLWPKALEIPIMEDSRLLHDSYLDNSQLVLIMLQEIPGLV